jgi:hypothetical protein
LPRAGALNPASESYSQRRSTPCKAGLCVIPDAEWESRAPRRPEAPCEEEEEEEEEEEGKKGKRKKDK